MQDRPDAAELAGALAGFLMEDVRPAVPDDLRFGVLVAANACAILAREIAAGDTPVVEEAEGLLGLMDRASDCPLPTDRDELQALRAQVAAAIRAGDLDDRWDDAVAVLRRTVAAKLAVAHPGYDEFVDDGHR
jgi:hypothetical protein